MKLFYSETLNKKISLDEVAKEVYNYIREDESKTYNVFAGTDSQRNKGKTCYVAIISVTRNGHGGINFINKEVVKEKVTMRQRIWNEATTSVNIFADLIGKFKELGLDTVDTIVEYDQVHADIGANGQSRELIDEITGFITAYGFKAIIKPDAFVAQCIANKFTKKF
jgi:predicted RNase H-related nuclease YkuK (DUF458 family)